MSTNKSEGNKSGGDFPEKSKSSSGKLHIQQLERKKEEADGSTMPKALNLLLCAFALCVLYGYYILFGWAWLTAMTELGEDLNWAFFGMMVAVGGGMMSGVAYSMKSQQRGWWEPLSPNDARKNRDPRGKCCGFQIY
jgi:hypothetical protein